MNLQRPDWHARWNFAVKGGVATLTLKYEMPRKVGTLSASQTLPEMLDFQSAVVLARSHGELAASIDQFVASFGWAQELAKTYAC